MLAGNTYHPPQNNPDSPFCSAEPPRKNTQTPSCCTPCRKEWKAKLQRLEAQLLQQRQEQAPASLPAMISSEAGIGGGVLGAINAILSEVDMADKASAWAPY